MIWIFARPLVWKEDEYGTGTNTAYGLGDGTDHLTNTIYGFGNGSGIGKGPCYGFGYGFGSIYGDGTRGDL